MFWANHGVAGPARPQATTTGPPVRARHEGGHSYLAEPGQRGAAGVRLGNAERPVAPDARIIGPRGFIIDRDEWIGVHRASAYQQVQLQPAEADLRTYDRVGIRFDIVDSECVYKGETHAGRFRGHPGLGHRPRRVGTRGGAIHLHSVTGGRQPSIQIAGPAASPRCRLRRACSAV
jgi:hypothetical protein